MDTMRPVGFVPADAGLRSAFPGRTAMRSPRSMFAMVAVAALATVFALTAFAGSVGAEKIASRGGSEAPPKGCPPGWEQAKHPLNPQLGCLPTEETAATGVEKDDPDPVGCPEGFVRAVPPLNPALGCIAATIAAKTGGELHPERCPEGWVRAEPPLNPDLGCLPDTLTS
jgi:hypothetical protein